MGEPVAAREPAAGTHEADGGLDAKILAILRAERGSGTVAASFERKEADLAVLFRGIRAADARLLLARCVRAAADDAVALELARLVPERRERLLAILADARRREAIDVGRCR